MLPFIIRGISGLMALVGSFIATKYMYELYAAIRQAENEADEDTEELNVNIPFKTNNEMYIIIASTFICGIFTAILGLAIITPV